MGFGQISRGSYIRGFFNLGYQIIYFIFMALFGVKNLLKVPTFGNVAMTEYADPLLGIQITNSIDDSFNILLIAVFSVAFTLILLFFWYGQINESIE